MENEKWKTENYLIKHFPFSVIRFPLIESFRCFFYAR